MTAFEDTLERFRVAVSGPAGEIPLARAALLIAQSEYPDLDVDAHERRLQDMAETLSQQLARSAGSEHPRHVVQAVTQLFFRELGFRGNTDHYDDPRNLYLNWVLSERRGIPVSLAIVVAEVCQRAGLDMQPVGLPGHVIVRYQPADGGEAVYLDVFKDGRVLSEADCQLLVRNLFGARIPFKPHYLEALSPRQTLQRLLHNLKAGHLQRGDEERASRVIDLLLAIFPWDLDEIRDRGMLRERLGDVDSALTDLEQYLRYRSGARDVDTITETVRSLRRHAQGRPGSA
ncbi:MAG: tetratricopeptide repeat protein [Chloroflexi bacterium]|nr:tetratricopeptide repeat protein [Chloroflexota bacterium]MDA1240931.1 tetratricopeptide repeat protein [Chloroflexota bacterium]